LEDPARAGDNAVEAARPQRRIHPHDRFANKATEPLARSALLPRCSDSASLAPRQRRIPLPSPWRTIFKTTVVENFGAIATRNASDVSFPVALGWRFGN